MEFWFAHIVMRIPIILAVVGTGFLWESTEVSQCCKLLACSCATMVGTYIHVPVDYIIVVGLKQTWKIFSTPQLNIHVYNLICCQNHCKFSEANMLHNGVFVHDVIYKINYCCHTVGLGSPCWGYKCLSGFRWLITVTMVTRWFKHIAWSNKIQY